MQCTFQNDSPTAGPVLVNSEAKQGPVNNPDRKRLSGRGLGPRKAELQSSASTVYREMFFPFDWEGGALCPIKWDYLPQALLFLTVWEIGRYYRISRLFMKLQGCLLFPESSKLSPCLFGVGKVMHYHFSLLGFLASVLPITFFFWLHHASFSMTMDHCGSSLGPDS